MNQTIKVIISEIKNTMVDVNNGTPSLSDRLSVISVPITLIKTTTSQYGRGMILFNPELQDKRRNKEYGHDN